jgi:putative NADH-flavin reductase
MKLLVLGPTGGLGTEIVNQAIDHGHHVTAFVRKPSRLTSKHDRLRVVQGDVLDGEAVEASIAGQDAVISALGVGESLKHRALIERSMPVIVHGMERQGVRRLIFTSAVILKLEQVPLIPKLFMMLLMSDLRRDKKAGEDLLRRSALDWTLIYPTRLTNGPKTGNYRSGGVLRLRGFPMVSRADVADLILNLVKDPSAIHQDIVVSN